MTLWLMLSVALVFVIVGLDYLHIDVTGGHAVRSCSGSNTVSCNHFRVDASMASFFVSFCCLIAAAELSASLQHPTRLVRTIATSLRPLYHFSQSVSPSARRLFLDIAVVVAAIVSCLMAGYVWRDGPPSLATWVRWELFVIVLVGVVLTVLEWIAKWRIVRSKIRSLVQELVMVLAAGVVFAGREWAGWSWSGIAITFAIVAGISALGNWLRLVEGEHNSDSLPKELK